MSLERRSENGSYQEILTRLDALLAARRPPDPTANVIGLMEQKDQRQDDLRLAESRRVDEQMVLRASYDEKLRDLEAKRIDAIRAVDVAAVATERERSNQTATVLANQVSSSAETLRNLVASTAAAVATNLQNVANQLADRLSLLEKSQYQIGGRDIQRDVAKVDVGRYFGYVVGAVGLAVALMKILNL